MQKKYFQAIAVIVGYTIGVGMFGLPFIVSKSGVLVFLAFIIVLGIVQHLLHLIYANMIVLTHKYHRLPGYVEIYLGKKGKIITFIAKLIGNYGALLAYLVITGIFLNQLFSPYLGGNEFIYSTILFIVEAFIIYCGIGMIARAEFFMTCFLLLIVCLITFKGWDLVRIENFAMIDWKYLLLPYGAILFSIDGGGSIPIVVKLLKRNRDKIKKAIIIGTMLSILVIVVFTLTITGISGGDTTPDALVGVTKIFGNGIIIAALIFGVLTMVTSFLLVAESVRETLSWDFNVERNIAWALAVFVPYILYILGFNNLTRIISLVGGVGGSMCAILMILSFLKLRKKKGKNIFLKHRISQVLIYFFIGIFILGMLYEIYFFLN